MKQNRVGALDISDEENSEDEIDASKIESFTARIEKRQKEIQENEEMDEENGDEEKSNIEEKPDKKPPKRKAEDHIDINQVMKKSKNVGRSDAEVVDIEDGTGETTTIREAFEDDDVISEFKKGKNQKIESEKPKVVDLILPGFDGEWAGEDYKPSKKLKKKFRLKQKTAPRKDRQLGHVIISEQNKKLEAMRIDRLPFPYQNPKQMEKVISQPIGATWNSASAVREMTKPAVMSNRGEIIEPATLPKEARFSDIFPVDDTTGDVTSDKSDAKNKKKKKSGKHKDNKERVFEKKRKGGFAIFFVVTDQLLKEDTKL